MNEVENLGNLNSLVDDGIELVDDPIDIQPLPQTEQSENKVSDQQLFNGHAIEGEVPKLKAQFELTTESLSKLHDLIKIKHRIQTRQAISTEDIQEVDAVSPGFINEERPLGQYTQMPSQTQLQEGLNDIDTLLEKQYDDLRLSIEELAQRYLDIHKEIPQYVNSQYYQVLTGLNKTYAQLLFRSNKSAIEQVKFLLNNKQSWGSFLRLHPGNLAQEHDDEHLQYYSKDMVEGYKSSFLYPGITQVDTSFRQITRFLSCLSEQNPLIYLGNNCYRIDTETGELAVTKADDEAYVIDKHTYQSLLAMIVSRFFREILSGLAKCLGTNITRISDGLQSLKEHHDSDQPIAAKISHMTRLSGFINDMIQQNNQICNALSSVFEVAKGYQCMLQALADKFQTPATSE